MRVKNAARRTCTGEAFRDIRNSNAVLRRNFVADFADADFHKGPTLADTLWIYTGKLLNS